MNAWYHKPGWWIFIVVSLMIWVGIVTSPSSGSNWTDPKAITVRGSIQCYVNIENPARMDCANPNPPPITGMAPRH